MIQPILGHNVEIYFDHTGEYAYGTIIRVNRRYGKQNGGRDFINPLIYYKTDEGEVKMCDSSFISRQWKPKHYIDYSPSKVKDRFVPMCHQDRIIDYLNMLIDQRRKQSVPAINFDRMIDQMLCDSLVTADDLLMSNRNLSKRVKKWIKQNLNRYIMSKKDYDRRMTEQHREDEAEIEKMLMEDMEW